MADGYLRIKTKVDNSEVSSSMSQLEKELATAERSADLLYQKFNRLNKQLSSFPHWKTDTSEYGRLVEQVNRSEIAFERAGDKASKLRDKLAQATDTQMLKSVGSINDGVNKMGSSIGNTIKKVLKWGVAIFGVRSAYMGIRSIINTISGYNQQIKTDLDYMKYTMAMAFQPIVEKIVKGFYTLLQLINEISIKLFNFNLFGKDSVDNFNKMSKGAKEIKKSLAGFDEMNVLGDQSTSGGSTSPSDDVSKETDILKGISKFVSDIISFWEDEWTNYFGFFNNEWDLAWIGALLTLEGFYITFKGVIETIQGLWDILVGLLTGDIDKIKLGAEKLVIGILHIVGGLFEIIIGLALTFVGLILGIFINIVKLIYDNVIKPIGYFFVSLWNGILFGVKELWNGIVNIFSIVSWWFDKYIGTPVSKVFNNLVNGIKDIFNNLWYGIKVGVISMVNFVIKAINTMVKGVLIPFNLIIDGLNKIPGTNIKKLKFTITPIELPKLATGGIVNRPTRAIVGESGPERIIPLSEDAEWINKVVDAISSKNSGNGTVNVYLDGRLIQRQIAQKTEELSFVMNR